MQQATNLIKTYSVNNNLWRWLSITIGPSSDKAEQGSLQSELDKASSTYDLPINGQFMSGS